METMKDPHNFVDIHFHLGPDEKKRARRAYEIAHEARKAQGWLVLKSHTLSTVPVAWDLRGEGLPVSGSVACNGQFDHAVIDYIAALARLNEERGGKKLIVFFPTRPYNQGANDTSFFASLTRLNTLGTDLVHVCVDLDVVLATGHISRESIFTLVEAYTRAGGKRLLLTHATHPIGGLTTHDVVTLGQQSGVYVELTALTYVLQRASLMDSSPIWLHCPRVVFSSDFGQPGNPTPAQWLPLSPRRELCYLEITRHNLL